MSSQSDKQDVFYQHYLTATRCFAIHQEKVGGTYAESSVLHLYVVYHCYGNEGTFISYTEQLSSLWYSWPYMEKYIWMPVYTLDCQHFVPIFLLYSTLFSKTIQWKLLVESIFHVNSKMLFESFNNNDISSINETLTKIKLAICRFLMYESELFALML